MILIIMGPSACGKSTLADYLSQHLEAIRLEGDDYHPPGNIEKMSSGCPLTDLDRWPWLLSLHRTICRHAQSKTSDLVLSCSALKHQYRMVLLYGRQCVPENACEDAIAPVHDSCSCDHSASRVSPFNHCFIYLRQPRDILELNLARRLDHFMPSSLLETQLQALEEPQDNVSSWMELKADHSNLLLEPRILVLDGKRSVEEWYMEMLERLFF